MTQTSDYGIHWFRRDLRLAGNPALRRNFQEHGGRVVGIFCFDHAFLSRPDFSPNRFQFFLNTLAELREEIAAAGGDLLVLDVGPSEAFSNLITELKRHDLPLPTTMSWNRDYEPFAVARDEKIAKLCQVHSIKPLTARDHLLIEPHEVCKPDGDGYQVFTPFSKAWLNVFATEDIQARLLEQTQGLKYLSARANGKTTQLFNLTWRAVTGDKFTIQDALDAYRNNNTKLVDVAMPPAGSVAAHKTLRAFADKLSKYGDLRDFPSIDGTSQLSIYLKNGSLTVAQIIAILDLKPDGKKIKNGAQKYLTELIWREFYYHILARHPEVEHTTFIKKYAAIQWENRSDYFAAWCEGRTGYPIVDAGMRQLNTTGWMHNRVRMIVASFLTKDLLVNWQWGERYFMQKLLDGDLAPNNGGWQWAASTGCDPQPYFRIFNPLLQSQRFDRDGDYIRRYIPKLRHLSNDDIHAPPQDKRGNYPAPIVEHHRQKDLALRLYAGFKDLT